MLKVFNVQCGINGRGWNFGDEYSIQLVREISNDEVERTDKPEEADLVAVGSLLHLVPGNYTGHIWGTGIIAEEHKIEYPWAKIDALRGKLTANRLGLRKDVPFGDPALLSRRPKVEQKFELGIVPHYVDWDNPEIWNLAKKNEGVLIIDALARDAPERIASCKNIISSSLHGVVFADAYGIPNMWTLITEGNGRISGNSFKFRDYYTAFDILDPIPFRFDKTHNLNMLLGYIQDSYEPKKLDGIRKDLLKSFPFRKLREWDSWEERTQKIAAFIPPGKRVLDLGSGQQTLKKYVTEYQPCDMSGDAVFCDFNFGIYPDVGHYDFVVVAGVLEYLKDPVEFLRKAIGYADAMILTYSVFENNLESRKSSGFVNHFTLTELIRLLAGIGLEFQQIDSWNEQVIGYVRI